MLSLWDTSRILAYHRLWQHTTSEKKLSNFCFCPAQCWFFRQQFIGNLYYPMSWQMYLLFYCTWNIYISFSYPPARSLEAMYGVKLSYFLLVMYTLYHFQWWWRHTQCFLMDQGVRKSYFCFTLDYILDLTIPYTWNHGRSQETWLLVFSMWEIWFTENKVGYPKTSIKTEQGTGQIMGSKKSSCYDEVPSSSDEVCVLPLGNVENQI